MKKLIVLFIFLISFVRPALACSCFFNVGLYDGSTQLMTIMSCHNNDCQSAVTVNYDSVANILKKSYPDEQTVLAHDIEIVPYQITYPADTAQPRKQAQQQFSELNGIYKIITVMKVNPYLDAGIETPAPVKVIQLSNTPGNKIIETEANKYEKANLVYTNLMLASTYFVSTLSNTALIAIILYLALLAITSIYVIACARLNEETTQFMLDKSSYLNNIRVYLIYFSFAFLYAFTMPLLQLRSPLMLSSYQAIGIIYQALTIVFLVIIYQGFYKLIKTKNLGLFEYLYILQRSILFIVMGCLFGIAGLNQAAGTLHSSFLLATLAFGLLCVMGSIFAYCISGAVNNHLTYLKLFAVIILYLLIGVVFIKPEIASLSLQINPAIVVIFTFYSYSLFLVFGWFIIQSVRLGLKKSTIIFNVILAGIVLWAIFDFARSPNCNCNVGSAYRSKYQSPLYDKYFSKYLEYSHTQNIRN